MGHITNKSDEHENWSVQGDVEELADTAALLTMAVLWRGVKVYWSISVICATQAR